MHVYKMLRDMSMHLCSFVMFLGEFRGLKNTAYAGKCFIWMEQMVILLEMCDGVNAKLCKFRLSKL